MIIEKLAKFSTVARRSYQFFDSARESWKFILEKKISEEPNIEVLIPAYIGWSSNEGSGIFDPIRELGLKVSFYEMSPSLAIDVSDLKSKCHSKVLVLLVHYFGFVDENYSTTCQWLKEREIDFIEDCAHALFSDFQGGVCGRNGSYSFYSLHKMLPISNGGMLISNNPDITLSENSAYKDFWGYDFNFIYNQRRTNYLKLAELLTTSETVRLLKEELPEGVCPQTLPVLVDRNRDYLYHEMNTAGFGMVSLYHTMIVEIGADRYPNSHHTARHIINFPVHQDLENLGMEKMVEKFLSLCK